MRKGGREVERPSRRPPAPPSVVYLALSTKSNFRFSPDIHSPFPSSPLLRSSQLPTLLANKAADAATRTKQGGLTLKAKSRGSLALSRATLAAIVKRETGASGVD